MPVAPLLRGLDAVTVFAEDLAATSAFYAEVLGLPQVFADDVSAAYRVGTVVVNVLLAAEAPELVAPHPVAGPGLGARAQLTAPVEDVDAVAAELVARGVTLLNGPLDRPWGVRTAAFADPAGTVWEIAQPLPR